MDIKKRTFGEKIEIIRDKTISKTLGVIQIGRKRYGVVLLVQSTAAVSAYNRRRVG